MKEEGPGLEALQSWQTEVPPIFGAEPERKGTPGGVRVRAVVGDLYEALVGEAPPDALLRAVDGQDSKAGDRNRLSWVLALAHVLWHPALRGRRPEPQQLIDLLTREAAALAEVAAVQALVEDQDRREELARRCLRALDLRPAGESLAQARDRLGQVDVVERQRVLREATERAKRAAEVRAAMRRKAAEEAASRVMGE